MKNKNSNIHKKLVEALQARQLETIEKLIDEGMKNDDKDPLLYSYQGNYYGIQLDFENAAKCHQKALELESIEERHEWHKNNISLSITLLGEQLLNKDQVKNAKECFTKAISLFPLARSYQQLGHINYLEDDLESSFDNLDKAEELNDKLATIYLTRGLCFFKSKKNDECEENLLKCLELQPANINAVIALSKFYTLKGDLAKSLEQLNSAQLIQPNNLNIIKDIINHNILMKNYTGANKTSSSYLKNNLPVSRSILSQQIYIDEMLNSDDKIIKEPFFYINNIKYDNNLFSFPKISKFPVVNNSNEFDFLDVSSDKKLFNTSIKLAEDYFTSNSPKEKLFLNYKPKYLDIRFFLSSNFTDKTINGVSTEYSWLNGIICYKENAKNENFFEINFNFSNTNYPENNKIDCSFTKKYKFDNLILFPAYLNYNIEANTGNGIKLLSINYIGFEKD